MIMRHRIAHILPWPYVGGTEHGTLRIAKAVDSSRFTNVAFCVPNADPVRSLFDNAGIPCATYEPPVPSYRSGAAFLSASFRLARELKRQRADLVHCADLYAAHHAALAARLAGLPVLSHIRNRFENMSSRDCTFLWPVKKFIFVSRDTWHRFGFSVSQGRGTVIYDGIDIPASDDGDRDRVRREFAIPETASVVGMMARVAPQKDFVTLARAAVRILEVQPQTRFLIVGDHTSASSYREHYDWVQALLRAHGVIDSFIFTGHRPDARRFLEAFDVFVLSTHSEGLPLVILEAMAQAKPVVATDVDGVPELIQHGETGLLHSHENHQELAAHVLTLLRDRTLAERIGAAGRRLVQTRFTTAEFATNMNSTYAAALALPVS
jgi:glycosyltransferase involved in cell wall biosynthesis